MNDNFSDLLAINWEQLAREYERKFRHQKVAESRGFYSFQTPNTPQIPSHLQLRKYQQQAIVSWLKNKGRGTLKMATGSGKTIIALAI
ncbi:MAG: DEAD/DEAH box helicase family protein, partial [Xenococcaceae cyanobacterium]